MPYYEFAEACPNYQPNIICPVPSCRKGVTQKQPVFVCGYCHKMYHPPCKGIIGAAKTKKAAESNWVCSPECITASTRASEVPVTSTAMNPCGSGIQCVTAVNGMMKRIDDQFDALKLMISNIQTSQEFICNEFDAIKVEINKIVAENVSLAKKCEFLQETYQKQDERIRTLEFNVDGFHQRELNANLIVVGLPDKLSEPKTIVENLFKLLQCEDSIADVISCDYMVSNKSYNQKSTLPEEAKIVIKFNNQLTKTKVVQQKKKIKPMLFSNEIGFQSNHQKQLYFRDHLTSLRISLFREARQIKKTYNYKYLWISEGNILFREAEGSRITRIQSRADINKITSTRSQVSVNSGV